MIPNEAVEAGARAVFAIREAGTPLLNERDVIRAALEDALPHLLGDPVAWIVYAENGNTRLWTGADGAERAQRLAAEWGTVAHPLYAHPTKGGEA